MKYGIVAAAILLTMSVTAWATTIDRVVAVVNNEIITGYQLEKELRTSQEANRRQVLDRLIQETLERQRAKEIGIEVPEEEVEAAIRDVQRQNDLSRSELEEALLAQGMNLEEYRENLRRQILRFQLLGHEVQSRVDVTSKEIGEYYRENIDDYREEAKVRLSHITFPVSQRLPAERIEALRATANDALARLRANEDLTEVLLAYAPQGAVGGDMGSFSVTELSPSFSRAVRDLNEGEISGLVENSQGFHLLKVTEVVPGTVRHLDSVRNEISEILREEKTGKALKDWAEGLRKKAYIDVRL